jgi:L-lactate dehydrogenase
MLDTARFRTRLGRILGVSPRSVHAYVLGEHGDSEVLVWSSASVGGIPLEAFLAQMGRPLTPHLRQEVDEAVRHGAARIIQGKGATYYGIGAAVAKIMKTIRDNEHALLTVSAPSPMLVGHPVPPCLSLPRVIGSDGIQAAFLPPLSPTEEEAIQKSARVLREAAQALEAR